ncbi:MAG: hypothetical protein JW976_08665 [Syntrophaceae bacterium]|nr:hypothetical protein [Syntrophaceae bacterium]
MTLLDSWYKKVAAAGIMLFCAFLLSYNLDDRMLWGDEAETALLAINITKYGAPKVTDGKNYITLFGKGVDTNKHDIWIWSPRIDSYIAAVSFSVLGKTTFAARFPFALLGFLSVFFLAFLTQKIYADNELTFIVVLLFATNVWFLLHARQCRYYSLTAFTQIWFMYGFYQLLRGQSVSGIINTVLPLLLQFYSTYIIVAPNLLVFGVSAFLFRKRVPGILKNIITSCAVFVILSVPWLIYSGAGQHLQGFVRKQFFDNLKFYLTEINFHISPIVIFAIPVFLYLLNLLKKLYDAILGKREKSKDQEKTAGDNSTNMGNNNESVKNFNLFLWMLIPASLFMLGITVHVFFRYLIPLTPVLLILSSIILITKVKARLFRWMLVLILCFSNILSFVCMPFGTIHEFEVPIIKYVEDITSKYENGFKDIVAFFKANASPEDTVLTPDPELPLIFYTNLKIIDLRLNHSFDFRKLPEWILSESASGLRDTGELKLSDQFKDQYELILLKIHGNSKHDNRPDPHLHAWFTNNKFRQFKIYKKKIVK